MYHGRKVIGLSSTQGLNFDRFQSTGTVRSHGRNLFGLEKVAMSNKPSVLLSVQDAPWTALHSLQ